MKSILGSIFNLLSSIYQSVKGLLWVTISNRDKMIRLLVYPNVKLKFIRFGFIAKKIYQQQALVSFKKSFEYETLEILKKSIKPSFHIVDIGANVGLHTLFMAKHISDEGFIYAFEPSQSTYDILNKNIIANQLEKKINTYKCALSDKEGELFLAPPNSSKVSETDKDAYNSLHESADSLDNSEKVKVLTLDKWVEDNNVIKINLIKIDIEGAELLCFRGGENVIAKFRPIIIMECYEPLFVRFGFTIMDIMMFLNKYDYNVSLYDGAYQWIATPKNRNTSN